ncbi:hypothetical protein BSL78_23915 [Apostichopus japonicus]|uniref:Sterile alpha motif domain-containing protein 3-like n=1 Tax=Stichopus japonicus TaxID=307972 RepID=A0A2G8JU04_STIJA|nr:hypothetical protein BSL78_23915 [Apostichopus japonicus]
MEVEGTGASLIQLTAKACQLFQLDVVTMQAWDKDFEEWADLDDDQTVPTNTKIKVLSTPSLVTLDASCSSEASCVGSIQSQDDSQQYEPSCSVLPVKTSTPTRSSLVTKSNWHISYKIPAFPDSVADKLRAGKLLKEAERSAVLESIYDDVKLYTYYPTALQYETIVKMLLDTYPKMKVQPDMAEADVTSLWKIRMQYKFCNARKREDSSIPAVKSRKRKAKTPPQTVKGKLDVPIWGMKNYLPSRPESEDDISINKHIEWMKLELSKKKPNYARVEECMSITLADRRRLIVEEDATSEVVKKVYPWLFEDEEILLEFKRLEGKTTMAQLLGEGLSKYGDAIIRCTLKMKHPTVIDTAMKNTSMEKDEGARKESRMHAAILSVPTLLNEKLGAMIVFADEDSVTDLSDVPVYIQVTEDEGVPEYTVIVETLEVATSKSLFAAMCNYLAVFYVLNMAYEPLLKKTLQFFQKIILNIDDTTPADKSVNKILEKLNMQMAKK